jgi:hypothetical protein
MGAESFTHEKKSKSASDAFYELVEQAEYEYGHQMYNGTISTCTLGGCKLTLKGITEENKDKAYNFIDENDNGEKWRADYIEIRSDNPNEQSLFIFYGWASC